MHHPAIGLCDLFAVSRRPRQATAEAKSRPFYDSDSFTLQFCRKSLCGSSLCQVLIDDYRMGVQVEQESSLDWDEDANRFGRCGGSGGIFSYSYLAVGP
jgi:hypothetical protein